MTNPAPHEPFDAVRIQRVRIQPDRAIIDIVVDSRTPARTSPAIAQRALALRPNLGSHACVNAHSRAGTAPPLFGDVMDDTPIVHLLEHLAVDVLAQRAREQGWEGCTFVGTSEWTDRAARMACIQLSCPDDVLVLRAFAEAQGLLSRIVVG